MGARQTAMGLMLVGVALAGGLWLRPEPAPSLPGLESVAPSPPPPAPAVPLQTDVFAVPPDQLFRFPAVAGPRQPSTVVVPEATPVDRYHGGGPSRLAVLLTDRASNWLGLAHGLKSLGIPFTVTEDVQDALRHRVVLVYPLISGRVLSADALRVLAAHPRNGGTLIGSAILGGGLEEVFGFQEIRSGSDRYEIHFTDGFPLTSAFRHPAERLIRLGDRAKGIASAGTWAYLNTKEPPLAVFEDGSAAIIQRSYGVGRAYAIGVDLGYLMLKGHNLRDEAIARSYDNRFEPMLDVWLRLVKALYQSGEPEAVFLHPVPHHRDLSIMLTHDIDAQTSMANALTYAEFERSQGIVGTYFIQTKYVRDYNDEIFFNAQGVRDMAKLHRLGMELGSHTVAHSRVLDRFPLGTGAEQYPAYTPYVKTRTSAANGTILGELRVSKFLVEQLSGGAKVVSFRPGELSNPKALPQALAATGYRYSSSATANNSLTHLPYQLMISRDVEAESEVFEFPVTIEDEELPELGSRVAQAIDVARSISNYGGCVVVLIHPNMLGHKLRFEQDFVAAMKDRAWFASVGQFGGWWAARNQVQVDVAAEGTRRSVTVTAPVTLSGLALEVPLFWRIVPNRRSPKILEQGDGFVVLDRLEGTRILTFDAPPLTHAEAL